MDQATQKQLQLNRIIRQAFDVNEVTTLSELTKYTKLLGSYLLRGMKTFGQLFKKHLQQKNVYCEAEPTTGDQINNYDKLQQGRVGLRINFGDFSCKESDIDAFKLNDTKEIEVKPVRAFRFSPEDLQDEQSLQMSSKEDLSFFSSRIGSKRIKKDEVNVQYQERPQAFYPESPEIQEHWRKIYNKVNQEWAVAVSNLKDKNQRERKKNAGMEDPGYRQYIKTVGKDLSQGVNIGEPNKKLMSLIKGKRQRQKVQMRPPRKYTHIEKETPQIYSVKRVLEVLDQQKEELMQEKRRKLEEALRAQRQARRLQQEARQRQRRALQEQLDAQRLQQEQRVRKERESFQRQKQQEQSIRTEAQPQVVEQKKQQMANSGLAVIQQREELNSQVAPEEELGVSGLAMKRKRNIDITDNQPVQPAVLLIPSQEKKPEEAPPQKNPLFSTPTKEEPKPEEKNFIPPLSEEKRKINPFIKTSPAPAMSLQELIKNDIKPTPFQTIMSSTPSTNLFAQNPGTVSNLFEGQTPQQQKQEPAQALYNSPTNFMNNPIRSNFPQNPVSTGPFLTQFGSPNSMVNNQTSSFQSSNANSSFGNEGASFNQQPPQGNVPNLFQTGGSLGLGMFTNNPNAVKLFQSNMFMGQVQPRSLFGQGSSQSARDYSSQRQAGRSKKPVRIS